MTSEGKEKLVVEDADGDNFHVHLVRFGTLSVFA